MSTPLAATVSDARPGAFRLSLLGRFNLVQDGRAIRLPTRKEESLLAYLVLHPGSHAREALAELYWGDTSEQQARGSLRAALVGLRAALGRDALLSDREVVQFSPSIPLSVDVLEFQAQARHFLSDSAADPTAFDPDLYHGDLLSGHYDDWVLAERDRLQQLYLDALLHLVTRLRSLARFEAAIAAARQALAVDPAEERAHRHLIYLYAVTGNRSAALRQLELCRRTLKEELDVEPSPETMGLLDAITWAPPEESTSAAAAAPAAVLTNLPVPLTSFIGRERELAEVSRLLEEGGEPAGAARLVTLTGAGGSGKTRLAIQSARQMIEHWRDGVWWTDLSSLQDPALLPQAMLAPFAVAPAPGQPPLQSLISYLHGRNLLLVLDNCERLTGACAHLVASVLSSCPHIQLLATSREPLGVPGEQLWPVPTFSVPVAAAGLDVEGLLGYDAVRLFTDRARMQRPAFGLSSDNAAAVTEICRRLDGIPLAIELAAARVRTMGLDDILARLQKRLHLLASGSALAPPRHQTLRASIDWTYNQLTPAECLLLQRLAVFAGGCTLTAVEAICAGGELSEADMLDLIGRLVDRSLVVAEAGRYRLLETIREYALERLVDAGESDAVPDRHSEHYLALVRELDSRLCSGDQKAALAQMETEIANIRLALEWAVCRRRVDWLREISFPLLYFYEIRGWSREGESIFREAAAKLEVFEETDPESERCRQLSLLDMQTNQAYFIGAFSKPAEAYALHRAHIERLRALGDKSVLRYALRYGGNMAAALGKFDEAEACLAESLALSHEAGRAWDIGIVNAYLGYLTKKAGAPERSQVFFGHAEKIGRELGDPRLLAFTLNGLGDLLVMLGQPNRAQALAEEALLLARSTYDRHDLASGWELLAELAIQRSEHDEARSLLARSFALWNEAGRTTALTGLHVLRGRAALASGDLPEAETQFCTALNLAGRYEQVVGALSALAGLAAVFAGKGEAEAAAVLVAFVLQQPSSAAETRHRAEGLLTQLEMQLTREQIQAAERRARAESLEELVQKLLAVSPVALAC